MLICDNLPDDLIYGQAVKKTKHGNGFTQLLFRGEFRGWGLVVRGNIREKNDGSELIENYLYFYSLDKNDFECLAVRNTVIEGKGAWDEAKYKENSEIMAKLWNEIADLADFDKVRRIDFRLFYKI